MAAAPVAATSAAIKVVAIKVVEAKAAETKVETVGNHLEAASSSLSPTTQMRNPSNGKDHKS